MRFLPHAWSTDTAVPSLAGGDLAREAGRGTYLQRLEWPLRFGKLRLEVSPRSCGSRSIQNDSGAATASGRQAQADDEEQRDDGRRDAPARLPGIQSRAIGPSIRPITMPSEIGIGMYSAVASAKIKKTTTPMRMTAVWTRPRARRSSALDFGGRRNDRCLFRGACRWRLSGPAFGPVLLAIQNAIS